MKVLTTLFFIILNFNVYGNSTTNWKTLFVLEYYLIDKLQVGKL